MRTTETKVADLLARFPANDLPFTNKLMGDMLLLGEPGIRQICDQVIPTGTGDDTRPRFAVESFSGFFPRVEKRLTERCGKRFVLVMRLPRKITELKISS